MSKSAASRRFLLGAFVVVVTMGGTGALALNAAAEEIMVSPAKPPVPGAAPAEADARAEGADVEESATSDIAHTVALLASGCLGITSEEEAPLVEACTDAADLQFSMLNAMYDRYSVPGDVGDVCLDAFDECAPAPTPSPARTAKPLPATPAAKPSPAVTPPAEPTTLKPTTGKPTTGKPSLEPAEPSETAEPTSPAEPTEPPAPTTPPFPPRVTLTPRITIIPTTTTPTTTAPTTIAPTTIATTTIAPTTIAPAPEPPATTPPAATEPSPTTPSPTEPAPTEPAPTEPAATTPAPTEPTPTTPADPGCTRPADAISPAPSDSPENGEETGQTQEGRLIAPLPDGSGTWIAWPGADGKVYLGRLGCDDELIAPPTAFEGTGLTGLHADADGGELVLTGADGSAYRIRFDNDGARRTR